jgi:hypothetical protein
MLGGSGRSHQKCRRAAGEPSPTPPALRQRPPGGNAGAQTTVFPALLYGRVIGRWRTIVAALMQATSLPFIVASTVIGRELGLIDRAESAALIAAGPLLVLAFPLAGLTLLRGADGRTSTPDGEPAPLMAM